MSSSFDFISWKIKLSTQNHSTKKFCLKENIFHRKNKLIKIKYFEQIDYLFTKVFEGNKDRMKNCDFLTLLQKIYINRDMKIKMLFIVNLNQIQAHVCNQIIINRFFIQR